MKLIKASKWVRGKGMLPSRIVIRYREGDNSYITHIQCKNNDGSYSYYIGHYDMSKAGALRDYKHRIHSL